MAAAGPPGPAHDKGRPCQSGQPSNTEQNFTAAESKPGSTVAIGRFGMS